MICIRKGQKIADEAAIIFTRSFYRALFGCVDMTVCRAFEIAKTQVRV